MGRHFVFFPAACFILTCVACLHGSCGAAFADQMNAGAQPEEDSGFMEELTEKAQKAKRLYEHTAEKIKNWSRKKLNTYLERLATYRPVLKKAGFDITQMRVRVGVVPRATVVCTQTKKLSSREREKLLEKHSDKEVLSLFLKLLFQAYDVKVSGYGTEAVWVTLSVTPHATTILVPEKESSENKAPPSKRGRQ